MPIIIALKEDTEVLLVIDTGSEFHDLIARAVCVTSWTACDRLVIGCAWYHAVSLQQGTAWGVIKSILKSKVLKARSVHTL